MRSGRGAGASVLCVDVFTSDLPFECVAGMANGNGSCGGASLRRLSESVEPSFGMNKCAADWLAMFKFLGVGAN